MKLTAIHAPHNTFCKGCSARLFISEQAYREPFAPVDAPTYCPSCAIKMTYEDPTRSVGQYYADVAGTKVLATLR